MKSWRQGTMELKGSSYVAATRLNHAGFELLCHGYGGKLALALCSGYALSMTDKKTPHAPAHGFDGAGHMDPAHAKRLLALAREGKPTDNDEAFVKKAHSDDGLAEELGEAAVASMTSGEEQLTSERDAEVIEERGGPFVNTSAGTEFAEGTDESNISEATREPFPTT